MHPDQKEKTNIAESGSPRGGPGSPVSGALPARHGLTPAERAANVEAAIARNRATRLKAGMPEADAPADAVGAPTCTDEQS
jgi:hypothetical protein